MNKFLIAAAASALLVAPASASITYSLTGTDFAGNATTLSFTTDSLLTANQSVPASGLDSCTYGSGGCSEAVFFVDVSSIGINGDNADAIAIFPADRTDLSVYVYYYFANGDLGLLGTHDSITAFANGSSGAAGTLRVTDTSSSPAPEPASWAMMLGGFGMIGGALRGRRRTSVAFG